MGLDGPSAPAPAAIVLDALAAPEDPALVEFLGAERAARLRSVMCARARRWAARVAPEIAFEATSTGAVTAALEGHAGPVVLAAPDVPGLTVELARAALVDLEEGVALSLAQATDGVPFLLALPSVDEELLELVGAHRDKFFEVLVARGGGLGMLRAERRLVSPADVVALAADPCAPEEILEVLRGLPGLQVRRGRADT